MARPLYILAFGLGVADEGFRTLADLTDRVHALRAGRDIVIQTVELERADGQPSGHGVSIRLLQSKDLVAYALLPFSRATGLRLFEQAMAEAEQRVAA